MAPPPRARIEALDAVARRETARRLRRLRRTVRETARGLLAALPGWTIQGRVAIGFPAQEILAQAAAWRADLVVVGSRGRSWWQRCVLGSVAREVAERAECDVRIVRGRLGAPGSAVSLVIGVDGSGAAHAAAMAAARRLWPPGSTARVVVALDRRLSAEGPRRRALAMAERAADLLRATGLHAHVVTAPGDPARVLRAEAKRADGLFVGARSLTGFERLMLGSVSGAVAAKAACTVEVIRPAPLLVDRTPADRWSAREPLSAALEGRYAMPTNRLKRFLDEEHVPYESVDHEPEYTAQRTAESSHISGRLMAKTVLVKVDGELAMVVVPASTRVDLRRLQQELGAERIELAREEEFEQLFPDSEPGAEPPFGNLYGLPVYVSQQLARNGQIAFNAGTHTEVLRMHYDDFERLVKPHLVG
jgi:Ala-tRNA(Pro) deacylase